MQTTRRPDVMKIWFTWKAKGLKGLSDQVDGTYRNTALCVSALKSRNRRFHLILPEFDSNLVCFYYIPYSIRFKNPEDIIKILIKNKVRFFIPNIMPKYSDF